MDKNWKVVKQDERYTVRDNSTLKQLITSTTLLNPHCSTTGHSHKGQEEVYIFRKGKGTMEIDEIYMPVEKGDIVFVDVDTQGETLEQEEVFGSVEAVKTVSDLFMPINGEVLLFNEKLEDKPELINSNPYGEGWIIKIAILDLTELDELLDASAYQELVG